MEIGPGDQVEAAGYPWGWEQLNFDDKQWLPAKQVANPAVVGYGTDNRWTFGTTQYSIDGRNTATYSKSSAGHREYRYPMIF